MARGDKNGDFQCELDGKVCPGISVELCSQEAEDKVTVTVALKPRVAFKVPSQVNMMPESILQTDAFYTRMNQPSKKHEIYTQASAT